MYTVVRIIFIAFFLNTISFSSAFTQESKLELLLPLNPGWNVLKEGEPVSLPLSINQEDTEIVAYRILNGELPGMEIDSIGNFTWTPGYDLVERLEEHKTFPIIFQVEGSNGETDSKQTEFTILHSNRPPEIKELKPFYVKYGVNNTYIVDAKSVVDPDNDPWIFKPIPSQMPEGLTLSENGKFEWKPSLTQYRRLRTEPLLLGFIIEDQPGKAEQKGSLLIKATHLDLPPEISILPDNRDIRINENETVNLKFFLSDPNGDENISEFNFLSEDSRIEPESLIKNANTQYEFVWTPGYDFVIGKKDSISFILTFYVIDKSNLRQNIPVHVTVYESENLIEKERQLYGAYKGALSRASELLLQLNDKEKQLKKDVKKARGGKRNRAIVDASLGAATGLSPVFLENQPQRYVSGIGGTTVMTLGTLEATEVIGRSSKELTEKLNYVLEKKTQVQGKGEIFARKYAFSAARQDPDFEKDLAAFLETMNLKNLATLELDAGWENKNKAPSDQQIKQAFNEFNPQND